MAQPGFLDSSAGHQISGTKDTERILRRHLELRSIEDLRNRKAILLRLAGRPCYDLSP